jgi:hypothetical protein
MKIRCLGPIPTPRIINYFFLEWGLGIIILKHSLEHSND